MSFKVSIRPSGHQFTVEPYESVLEAALRQEIDFPFGCQSGACGTCMGKVLKGDINYPDGLPMALSDEDHDEGRALFCMAEAESDLVIEVAEIPVLHEIEIKLLPSRVEKLYKLADNIMEMHLKLPETEPLKFLAGQYIDILLSEGRRRSFSLANAPQGQPWLELHLKHVKGGYFTDQVFNQMKTKSLLRIEGPLGGFFIREDSDHPIIMMSGGTGFAPLKSMIEHMLNQGVTRPIYLYRGANTQDELYMNALAQGWADRYAHIHYVPVLSATTEEDNWEGRTGFVHKAVAEDFSDMSAYDVYMSGPPPMIQAARKQFAQQNLPESQLFYDSFEFSEDAQKAMGS